MGNRAVITLDKKPTANSVGIYLHWNGGEESVLAFAEAARHFKVRGDDYGAARLVNIIGNFIGGTLSLGVSTLGKMDCDNGDNGLFYVNWIEPTEPGLEPVVKMINWPDGDWTKDGIAVDCDKIKKQHCYWSGKKNLLTLIIEANEAILNNGGGK